MSWNYRVMRSEQGELLIHEVGYAENGEISSWSEAVPAAGDSLDELRVDLEHMRQAVALPVLEVKDGVLRIVSES